VLGPPVLDVGHRAACGTPLGFGFQPGCFPQGVPLAAPGDDRRPCWSTGGVATGEDPDLPDPWTALAVDATELAAAKAGHEPVFTRICDLVCAWMSPERSGMSPERWRQNPRSAT
jgi:hypothetical protein